MFSGEALWARCAFQGLNCNSLAGVCPEYEYYTVGGALAGLHERFKFSRSGREHDIHFAPVITMSAV